MIEAAKPDPNGLLFGVWDENAETVMMWLKLQTQWRVIEGIVHGLNYQAIQFLFTIHGVANQAAMMDDLQAMEAAALSILNTRKE